MGVVTDRTGDRKAVANHLAKPPVLTRATQRILCGLCLCAVIYMGRWGRSPATAAGGCTGQLRGSGCRPELLDTLRIYGPTPCSISPWGWP